jgi:toxin HigB-1
MGIMLAAFVARIRCERLQVVAFQLRENLGTLPGFSLLDTRHVTRYAMAMIKSFKDKETQKLWMGRKSKAVSAEAARRAQRKLRDIELAQSVEELKVPPANHLHKLGGKRKGQWAISVDKQYRICLFFEDGHAYEVEATDYH